MQRKTKKTKSPLSEYQKAMMRSDFPKNCSYFINAVAGSGKSTSMVELSHHLHTTKQVNANKQRLITFSNKAAKDLQSKINVKFKSSKYRPKVSTLHGMCTQLLREYVKVDVTTLTQWQSILMVRGILINIGFFKLGEDMKGRSSVAMGVLEHLDFIKSNVKCNAHTLEGGNFRLSSFSSTGNKDLISDKDFSLVVKSYEAEKRKQNVYDFSDLIFRLVTYLESDPSLLKKCRDSIGWLCSDEAQDNCLLDLSIIILLTKNKRVSFVGDKDQTIYQFRHAVESRFSEDFLAKYWKEVKTFELPINYRSTSNIVEFCNVIRFIKDEEGLQAIPHRKRVKGSITLNKVENSNQEAVFIAKAIVSKVTEEGYDYKDIVIIATKNSYLNQTIEPMLIKYGIPYQLTNKRANRKLTEKDSVHFYKACISYSVNVKAVSVFVETLRFIRGWGVSSVNRISEALINNPDISSIKKVEGVSADSLERAKTLFKDLHILSEYLSGVVEVKEYLEALSHIIGVYGKKDLLTDKEKWKVEKTIGHYLQYYKEELNMTDYREMFKLMCQELDGEEETDGKDKVHLATIHSQKGLSNKIYYAGGFVSHKPRLDLDNEQINVFYVQCSRAEEELHLVYSGKYVTKDGRVRNGSIAKPLLSVMQKIVGEGI